MSKYHSLYHHEVQVQVFEGSVYTADDIYSRLCKYEFKIILVLFTVDQLLVVFHIRTNLLGNMVAVRSSFHHPDVVKQYDMWPSLQVKLRLLPSG